MTELQRRSPVQFKTGAQKIEMRDNWPVVLEYRDEGRGPFLVDLTHKAKWDLQDKHLALRKPLGLDIPDLPGACTFQQGVLINRLNRTQSAMWHLLADAPALPGEPGYTDVTEATVLVALFGPNVLAITEKLTALDLLDPLKQTPFLLQGPFSNVPCQVVTLARGRGFDGGLLLTCSRGYAQSMVHAILDAGAEFDLRPAGEQRFSAWASGLC
ncbi:Aminomethyltransferase folate-binding domain-containing protein [Desulfotomaculum arcticum]|uniref:Aminomethyltransferase folate-binding domain-containing protein n=1 Tax=Desulfotruncus arcticus DSM 17038 TaxID=1121424 RepID=A0A1I2RSQ7_9FIRM|nr:sarcosine oxidase subunit gamma SoxG [Desulfotruncus arcticus]SFG40786.1 Aminomethyltransferase folate-binding domain-containing protein [Desulfotomaculum arcticum] [Desulfotruncus arcticus DSM 17038]